MKEDKTPNEMALWIATVALILSATALIIKIAILTKMG